MPYDIIITGPETRALIELRGAQATLAAHAPDLLAVWPARPCSKVLHEGRSLLWLGPDRWMLMAPLDHEDRLQAALCDTYWSDAGVTLISDTLAFFTVSGRDAAVAMSIACPLDVHADAFAPDTVAETDAFGVRAMVLRANDDWLLAVAPAYARYIAGQLGQIV